MARDREMAPWQLEKVGLASASIATGLLSARSTILLPFARTQRRFQTCQALLIEGHARLQPRRLPKALDSLVAPPELHQCATEAMMRPGISRPQPDRLGELLPGFLAASEL